jgi:hypothetical protein
MSRKHFIALAATLRAAQPDMSPDAYMRLVTAMALLCEAQSSTFNRQRFVDACYLEIEQ